MPEKRTRREFLTQVGAAAAVVVVGSSTVVTHAAESAALEPRALARADARVVIARDEVLTRSPVTQQGDLPRKLLDAAMQRLMQSPDPASAWCQLFGPKDRVGLKVNTLGLSTRPTVVEAIVAGLLGAGVRAENIIIWDRFDVELAKAGFKLNRSRDGVRCYGTDAEQVGSGYLDQVESNGQIGSCFSRIVAEQVDALICVPVLKDHNLAGVSLGLKNFYGAIHNPNKYHTTHCDPYVVDVVSHRYIAPKWRLTVCDATAAQYHAGPARHPGFAWPFGGLIVSNDFVAADAVGADLLEAKRQAEGLPSLAEEQRPPKHIATAAARGLGVADLSRIERIEV